MKLICLNIWGGKLFDPILSFIKEESASTDIFCFQEVLSSDSTGATLRSGTRPNVYEKILEVIPHFKSYFSASESNHDFDGLPINFNMSQGLAIFLKPPIETSAVHKTSVYETESGKVESIFKRPKILQHSEVKFLGKKNLHLFNFHGLLDDGAKMDTPLRDAQFAIVKEVISKYNGSKILCGDFNIRPNTENITNLGKEMRDLIREYEIPKTRNKFYSGMEEYNDFISDYVFVSGDIKVKSFKILDIEISDHLPLILEFDY